MLPACRHNREERSARRGAFAARRKVELLLSRSGVSSVDRVFGHDGISGSRIGRTVTITAHACKTARRTRIASQSQFATHSLHGFNRPPRPAGLATWPRGSGGEGRTHRRTKKSDPAEPVHKVRPRSRRLYPSSRPHTTVRKIRRGYRWN